MAKRRRLKRKARPAAEDPSAQTAIARDELSRPVKELIASGLLKKGRTFFDYGQGRGDDVRILRSRGYTAAGWDPNSAPEAKKAPADVVNLGFVINVIKSPQERIKALKSAFNLAKVVLSVAARTDGQGEERTSTGSFQKYYTQETLTKYVESVLGRRACPISQGVVVAFANEAAEKAFCDTKKETDERKAIDSGSLAGGGKKKPARGFPDEERKKADAALRDDFGAELARYARATGSDQVEKRLRELVKEAVARGPEAIQFDPAGMLPGVRSFFYQLAREAKAPAEMFKRLDLRPDIDPARMSTGELLAAHWELHKLYRAKSASWSTEDLSNLHASVVDELFVRKAHHPAPPDEGLDSTSSTFEAHSGEQPNWAETPPARVEKVFPDELPEVEFKAARISKPFSSPGGKDLWAKRIVAALPEHKAYIEPYAGSATVFFAKAPSDVEVLSDVNPEIVNMLRFIQSGSDQDFEWIRSQFWKWSKEHFEKLKATSPEGRRERAYKFKYLNLYSYRGAGDKFNPTATASKETTGGEFLRKLEAWRERLNGVKILQKDALEVMREYDSAKTAFYVDPPWKDLTGRDEWKNFNPEELLAALKGLKGRVLMSYQGDIDLGKGWTSRALSATQGGIAGSSSQQIHSNFAAKALDEWATKSDELAAEVDHLGQLAARSKREDTVHLGRFFSMPTPARYVVKGERQSVERFLAILSRPEWLPAVVQKKTEGVHVQAHRFAERVKVFTEDKVDVTDQLPEIVSAIKALKAEEVVLVGILEAWRGRQRMPAQVVVDHLAGKIDASGELVLSVTDVPYQSTDIHKSDASSRFGYDRAAGLGIPQITMGAPSSRSKLNAVVGVKVYSLTALEKAVRRIRELPGAVGVVVKQAAAEFELGEAAKGWVELHTTTELRAAIIAREEANSGSWVYRCASLPSGSSGELVNMEGVEYAPIVGELTADRELELGEKLRIEADLVTIEKDPAGDIVTIEAPRVIGQVDQLDTVDQLTERARSDFALREIEGGEPRPVERAITKQGDPFMEIPPEQAHRYVVHNHFTGGSFRSELRVELRSGRTLLGWTLKTQAADVGPVATLSQARAIEKKLSELSRVDWGTGEWGEPVQAEKKAPHPYAWIDVEGATKKPEEGEPPPVGATDTDPGVFQIVDKGRVEYGAQLSELHEYFFRGAALRYPVIFRKTEAGWVAARPKDAIPYVLGDAVKKGWIPPVGISALPSELRAQVPVELRYWDKTTPADARATRDQLAGAISSGDATIDFGAAYERASKATNADARFVLHRQTFGGPVPIELGSDRSIWCIRIDTGQSALTVVTAKADPTTEELSVGLGRDRHRESMEVEGELAPAHYLNPSKETISRVEKVDSGRAVVLVRSPDFMRIKLAGDTLRGSFHVRKEGDKWIWGPGDGPVAKNIGSEEVRIAVPILKVNAEKQLATGVVLEPDEVDAQNDTQGPDVVQAAAHDFLGAYNRATELGINHTIFGDIGVKLAESWIAPFDLKLGDQDIKAGSWILTVKVEDPARWAQIKRGEITGFSIGGWASVRDPSSRNT